MWCSIILLCFFFFNDTATTEIYTLSLHDALPICPSRRDVASPYSFSCAPSSARTPRSPREHGWSSSDRKSTRLNSSHANISYAVFCLKKKKNYICNQLQ